MLKIKQFSEETGFSIRMLRYLEEVGILVPQRDSSNYRSYALELVDEARWIKKLQILGFQLKEVEIIKQEKASSQLKVLKDVLKREQEVAEIKSETIPVLKNLIDHISIEGKTLQEVYQLNSIKSKKLKTLDTDNKFIRTAYQIPILRNIYEDHLTANANIELIATDLMKFSDWFSNCEFNPSVFSVLNESSFVFGNQISQEFIEGYEIAWKKFLPEMGFKELNDFNKEDVSQLMGPHDMIIRSTFKYRDSSIEGEIVIPYSPIYTMSQLSTKN